MAASPDATTLCPTHVAPTDATSSAPSPRARCPTSQSWLRGPTFSITGASDAASGASDAASGASDAASGASDVASGASDAASGASDAASGATGAGIAIAARLLALANFTTATFISALIPNAVSAPSLHAIAKPTVPDSSSISSATLPAAARLPAALLAIALAATAATAAIGTLGMWWLNDSRVRIPGARIAPTVGHMV